MGVKTHLICRNTEV